MSKLSKEIFKAYDIRGVMGKTLNADVALLIGKAIGTEAHARQIGAIVVGRDGRISGPELSEALVQGILSTGVDVIDIDRVATPILYFAAYDLGMRSGVMITGSHNPADYNGFKILLDGETLAGEAIQQLYQRIRHTDFAEGEGRYQTQNVFEAYMDRVTSDVKLSRTMNIVVDCGNGVAGAFAPVLYRRLGCKVRELFCDVDGQFPNHHPDPAKPDNLNDLIEALQKTDAEIGLAFDGDGDRLGVVTKEGKIIWPDRQLMLFAADVLERNPKAKILYDVKSTRLLKSWIKKMGGTPVMARTGHSFMKAKMQETGALLAGEMSGHIFFKERWYGFDDALYAGARLLEILSRIDAPTELFNALPDGISTPEITIKLPKEGLNHTLIERLQEQAHFTEAKEVNNLDGLRVEYKDGFGLIRASNTTPTLVLRFEADSEAALERIQEDFRAVLSDLTDITLPF